jgi:hypothetical protein
MKVLSHRILIDVVVVVVVVAVVVVVVVVERLTVTGLPLEDLPEEPSHLHTRQRG